MRKQLISIGIVLTLFNLSCVDYTCDEVLINLIGDEEGSLMVDTIYHKFGEKGDYLANKNRDKILYRETHFVLKPRIGDSIIKKRGYSWYILFHNDSAYVLQFSCKKKQAEILDSWKINDSIKFRYWIYTQPTVKKEQ